MSYWGSSFSLLGHEKENDGEEDNEKELRESMSITKGQMEELKECFKICDKSGKGFITPEEFKVVMRSVGNDLDGEDMRELFYEIDDNSSGHIDFIEFLQLMNKRIKEPITEDDIRQCFNILDKEELGYLTIRGLEEVFRSLGQNRTDEELKEMMTFIDKNNGNGLIEYEAFKKYLEEENLLRRKQTAKEEGEADRGKSIGSMDIGQNQLKKR